MKTVLCPGSFDPVTVGHMGIIRRSAFMFDKVIVVVMSNYQKRNSHAFSAEERVELLKRCTKNLPNVEVEAYEGLLAEYARQKQAVAVVKGLRAVSDFEYEFQLAQMNRQLAPEIETFFIATDAKYSYLSSRGIKAAFQFGGAVRDMVPPGVYRRLRERIPPREM